MWKGCAATNELSGPLSGRSESLSCFLTTFVTARKFSSAYRLSMSTSSARCRKRVRAWRVSCGTCGWVIMSSMISLGLVLAKVLWRSPEEKTPARPRELGLIIGEILTQRSATHLAVNTRDATDEK